MAEICRLSEKQKINLHIFCSVFGVLGDLTGDGARWCGEVGLFGVGVLDCGGGVCCGGAMAAGGGAVWGVACLC